MSSKQIISRYAALFGRHIDGVFDAFELFTGDFNEAESHTVTVLSSVWSEFSIVDPNFRDAVVLDRTWQQLHRIPDPTIPLEPDRLSEPPLLGEWSATNPTDAAEAAAILYEARRRSPMVDWPLLVLMERTALTVELYARIAQLTPTEANARLTAARMAAQAVFAEVVLEAFGVDCPRRPVFGHGPISEVSDHVIVCETCGPLVADLVPLPHLIVASATTPLTDMDRRRIFVACTATEPKRARRRQWWHSQ